MAIKCLKWQRSRVFVGIIGVLLLLGSSQFSAETKTIWSGWWVAQQRSPSLVWESKAVKQKQAGWHVWLSGAIHRCRSWLKGAKRHSLQGYLLVLLGVSWVWLLRRHVSGLVAENELTGQGNVVWQGSLSNQRTVLSVGLEVRVSEARVAERGEATPLSMAVSQPEVGDEIAWDSGLAIPLAPAGEVALSDPRATQVGKCLWQGASARPVVVGCAKKAAAVGQQSETAQRAQTPLTLIEQHFCDLKDPRMMRTRKHALFDIVTITICAVIGGADNWVEVAAFGQAKAAWLQGFLALPNGIPSHDTFGRVFRLLDPQQWQDGFLSWVEAITQATKGQIVPIDGKALRRSHDKALGAKAIHMVSAWASESRVVLGQVKVDKKSNEITAIPALLEMLTLTGCIVTIDAMGCQKEIANKIIDKDADYALALKKNQNGLYEGVKALFDTAQLDEFDSPQYHKTVEKSHGRHETRQCWTISDPTRLAELHNFSAWQGLQTIVCIKAQQQRGNKTTTEERFYISSLATDAEHLLQVVRGHWSIENSLHWVLDVAFREDESRIRKGHGAQNFAVLRHLALNLLAQVSSANGGINAKRKRAGWDETFLLNILDNST